MDDCLKELYLKICSEKEYSILTKLDIEYGLFFISKGREFNLIRAKGIFLDKAFMEELQNNYSLWQDVFNLKIHTFTYDNFSYLVMVDNTNDVKYCLFMKINSFLSQLNLQCIYLIFLIEIEFLLHTTMGIPSWYKDLIWNHIPKKTPILILSEIGSFDDVFLEKYIQIKTGKKNNYVVFETLNLDEKIQLFEFFGYEPGERFKTKHIIPIFDVQSDAIIIKEITFLTKEVQKHLLSYLTTNKEKLKQILWFFTSNYDIEKMVKYYQFNPDLWEFLKGNIILLPPLRKVREQLHEEIFNYLNHLSHIYRKKIKISEQAWNKILTYDWPGNLEELYLTLESAFILSKGETIEEKDVVLGLWNIDEKKDLNLRRSIENLEKKFIMKAYRLLGGNQVHMANTLGISRGSLQYKLQKYGIKIYD